MNVTTFHDMASWMRQHTEKNVFVGAKVAFTTREGNTALLRVGEVTGILDNEHVSLRTDTGREIIRPFYQVGVLL